jgi:hypothetical protein
MAQPPSAQRGFKDILFEILEERGGRIELVRLAISIALLIALLVVAYCSGGGT